MGYNSYSGFYKGKNVLLIGGLGFIGRALAERLLSLNTSVTIVERNASPGSRKHAFCKEFYDKCRVIDANPLLDFKSLESHLSRADLVLNLISARKSAEPSSAILELDRKMLEYCESNALKPVFIHIGSRLQYTPPINPELPIVEESPLGPLTPYGADKLASEHEFLRYHTECGLATICLRAGNVYGPSKQLAEKRGAVDTLIYSALQGKIGISGDPDRYKDLLYIDDFTNALLLCASNPGSYGKVLNIGSGQGIRMMDIANAVRGVFNPGAEIVVNEQKADWDFSYYLCTRKIRALTGWFPKTSFRDGLQKIKHYLLEER